MIDPVDLFICSFDLVVLQCHLAIERCHPCLCTNVVMGMRMFKKLKFRYETILHELLPQENRS